MTNFTLSTKKMGYFWGTYKKLHFLLRLYFMPVNKPDSMSPGALHHIMVRGINKADIFDVDQYRTRFLERIGVMVTEGHCAPYAWALMTKSKKALGKTEGFR